MKPCWCSKQCCFTNEDLSLGLCVWFAAFLHTLNWCISEAPVMK